MRWDGLVERMGEGNIAYGVLMGIHGRSRPIVTPRSRREDNIKIN